MFLDVNDDVEVARRPATNSGFAVLRRAQARAVGDTRRDLEFDRARFFDAAFAVANTARFLDYLARAATTRTGLRNLEKSARADDLSATAAGRTVNGARTRLGAAALAFVARVELAYLDLLLNAERCFLKRDLHVVTQIAATLSAFAIDTGATAAEERLEDSASESATTTTSAENFAENIEWIMEAAATAPALCERRVAEAVVSRTFVAIHQDVVGLAEFLKMFFGVRIVRGLVRAKVDRQLAVGAFHVLLRRRPLYAQNFVVVALCRGHRSER